MKGEDKRRTAILVDPHPLWIDAVEQVVAAVPIEVVAKLASLEEGQELIPRLEPDVIVAEIALGADKADGLGWLRRTAELSAAKIIVLTTCSDPDYIGAALGAGAWGYVLKTAHPDDLKITVRQAFELSIFFPAATNAHTPQMHATPPAGAQNLTKRELEILALVAEGHPNAKVAQILWVTEQTVKFHLSNIYRKLDVSNRTEASRSAQLHALFPAGPQAGHTT